MKSTTLENLNTLARNKDLEEWIVGVKLAEVHKDTSNPSIRRYYSVNGFFHTLAKTIEEARKRAAASIDMMYGDSVRIVKYTNTRLAKVVHPLPGLTLRQHYSVK